MKKFKVFPLILISLSFIGLGIISAIIFNKLSSNNDLTEIRFSYNSLPKNDYLDYKTNLNYNDIISKEKVLLIYLQTTCRGCQIETEIISKSDFYKETGYKVFGISNEDTKTIENFVAEHNVKFPIIQDNNDKIRKSLDVIAFPANFVIKNGIIEKYWFGTTQNLSELKEKLESVPNN